MPWDDARRTARRLEAAAEAEVAAYAKLAAAADDAFAGGERGLSAQQLAAAKAAAVDRLLTQLEAAVSDLAREASGDGAAGGDGARAHTAARAGAVARELRGRYARLHATVTAAAERAALFGGGGGGGGPDGGGPGGGTRASSLLRERGLLASAHAALDDVLGVASATGGALADQRGRLGGAAGRLASVGDRFPVIGGLLQAIRRRRDRDSMIVAGVAGACTFFILVYWWAK